LLVRDERSGDADSITLVHESSFPSGDEATLVARLREGDHLVASLVAEEDGVVVGHVAFSPVSAAIGPVGAGLGPVAVLEGHRNRGVARRLIEAGLAVCRRRGFGWAAVLGKPQYYSRLGFEPASEFGLVDEYGGGDAFQVLELTAGRLPAGAGLVRYGPEFASVSEPPDRGVRRTPSHRDG